MPKISAYPTMTTPSNDDLFDVSQIQLDGTYISKALSWADIVSAIGAVVEQTFILMMEHWMRTEKWTWQISHFHF